VHALRSSSCTTDFACQVWVTIAAKLNYDIVKLNENKVA
jgi:hypothetical protein